MEIIQKPTINSVAERWERQYCRSGVWTSTFSGPAEITHQKILASTTLDEVDEAIGNTSWTHNSCSVCDKSSRKPMAMFWAEPDYSGALVCKACLKATRKALKELDK